MNAGCTLNATVGPCRSFTCPSATPQGIGAGTLTLTTPQGTTIVQQNPAGSVYSTPLASPFKAGDTLGVTASGGQVPAFGPVDVVAPGPITLTAPAGGTIVTTQDLVWTWTGGEPGASVLAEAYSFEPNASSTAVCTFDATSGSGTMPASVLAPLQGTSGSLVWSQQRSTSYTAGTYPASVGAARLGHAVVTFQ